MVDAVSSERLTDEERDVLSRLKENPSCRLDDVSEQTGIKRGTLGKMIVSLHERGYVNRVGSKRYGRWVVPLLL